VSLNLNPYETNKHGEAIEKAIERAAEEIGCDGIYACLESHWGPHSEDKCNIFSARHKFDGYYDKDEVRDAYAKGKIKEWLNVAIIQAKILGEFE
jgi:hypothetical protein